jgi:hypothetical protein
MSTSLCEAPYTRHDQQEGETGFLRTMQSVCCMQVVRERSCAMAIDDGTDRVSATLGMAVVRRAGSEARKGRGEI